MVKLILCQAINHITYEIETVVSHGVDMETDEDVKLFNGYPKDMGYYDADLQEWILKEE